MLEPVCAKIQEKIKGSPCYAFPASYELFQRPSRTLEEQKEETKEKKTKGTKTLYAP